MNKVTNQKSRKGVCYTVLRKAFLRVRVISNTGYVDFALALVTWKNFSKSTIELFAIFFFFRCCVQKNSKSTTYFAY